MRKITLLAILVFAVISGYSQYYYLPHLNAATNPGGLNADAEYPSGSGLDASWTQILGGTNTTPAWSAVKTLPFAFNFNGNAVTKFKVSSSGVLTFDTAATTVPAYSKAALPSASIPDNSICIWGLEGTGSNDYIMHKTFGSAPNRQYWVFFTSYNFQGGSTTTWTYWSIVMEETSNKIYIVDQRTGNGTTAMSAGIQINSTTAISIATSPSLANLATTDATQADNSYYEFIYGTQPAKDFQMNAFTNAPYWNPSNGAITLAGSLTNLGSETITSFDINYKVGNNPTVTAQITGASIAFGTNYSFSHPTTWNPPVGTYDIKMWASNLNGGADVNHLNDTAYHSIQVTSAIVPRLPLYEAFTSSTCAPCVAGNANLKSLFEDNPNKWVCVKYQMSWPGNGDPYYTAEGGVRRTYYSVSSVPNLAVDGGWNDNTSSFTQADVNTYYNTPSFVDLAATLLIDSASKNVKVVVNFDANIDLPASAILHVAIVEGLTYNNVETNGETEFEWVMKKMLPNGSGTVVGPVTTGTPVTKNFEYTFNGNYRLPASALDPINHTIEHSVEEFSDLYAVVWLQNNSNKEVYQSCYATNITGINPAGFQDVVTAVYPNPANDIVNFDFHMKSDENISLQVISTTGQVIKSQDFGTLSGIQKISVDIDDLSEGIYFFKFNVGSIIYTKPIIVK